MQILRNISLNIFISALPFARSLWRFATPGPSGLSSSSGPGELKCKKKWLIPTMKPMWQTLLFFYYFFSSESIPLPDRLISTSVLQHVGLVLSLFADYFISYNRKLQTSLVLRMHMFFFFFLLMRNTTAVSIFFLIYILFNCKHIR